MTIIETLRKKGYRVKVYDSNFVTIYNGNTQYECTNLKQIKEACDILGVPHDIFPEKPVATYL